ncbi:MAG: hypothetical protein JRI36_07335 [Deltaproteobacteria bacterium]|nr:hypothetical protein [Deltaproteobacteria bacterium]
MMPSLCQRAGLDIVRCYRARLDEAFRATYDGFQAAQRWLSRLWMYAHVAGPAMKTAYVRQAVAWIITREVDPRRLFSPRAVLRSLGRPHQP